MLVTFGICLKQYVDTRYLVFYNTSPPRMFLSLDFRWEYRIQHGANGPLYVTPSYLPPACWSTFWKSNSKQQLGCRLDIMDIESYFYWCFDICNYICLDTSDHFAVLHHCTHGWCRDHLCMRIIWPHTIYTRRVVCIARFIASIHPKGLYLEGFHSIPVMFYI